MVIPYDDTVSEFFGRNARVRERTLLPDDIGTLLRCEEFGRSRPVRHNEEADDADYAGNDAIYNLPMTLIRQATNEVVSIHT